MGKRRALVTATRYETKGISGGTGTTITAGAANIKGSFVVLGTTGFKYDGFQVFLHGVYTGANPRYRMDISANTGGADQVIVADLCGDQTPTAWYYLAGTMFVPVSVPAGAVLKARLQSTVASSLMAVGILGYSGDAKATTGFRALESVIDWGLAIPAAPSLSASAGGALAATTYYVKITYTSGIGESQTSPEGSLAVAANDVLSVTSPSASPAITGYNVYVSTATGTETKQTATPIAIGTNWTEPTSGLISGTAPPVANGPTDTFNTLTLSGTTLTPWTQVMASTPVRIAALYFTLECLGTPPSTYCTTVFEIGIGASGNEHTTGIEILAIPSTERRFGPFLCDIAAGTRISVRAQCNAANTNSYGIVLHGLAA